MRRSPGSFPILCGVIHTHTLVHKQLLRLSPRLSTLVSEEISSSPIPFESSYRYFIPEPERSPKSVGVTDFVDSQPKLSAIVKERCEDFQVHEIDTNGKKVELTKLYDKHEFKKVVGLGEQSPPRKYIHFTVFKKNLESSGAASILMSNFKLLNGSIPSGCRIEFAGRKDKQAITCQRMSIKNVDGVEKLFQQFSRLDNEREDGQRNLIVGNFTPSEFTISVGYNKGNNFRILLRNVTSLQNPTTTTDLNETINNAVNTFREKGFINYFGHQRFGVHSHLIGKALFQNNWEQAVEMMIRPASEDHANYVMEMNKIWDTSRDPVKMAELIPENLKNVNDRNIMVRGLSHHYSYGDKEEFKKAYYYLQFPVRSLHVQAFLSYLWNKVVSFRIQKYGLQVIHGDCIHVPSSGPSDTSGVQDYCIPALSGEISKRKEITVLKKHNVKKFSIADVLLPVPGTKIRKFPNPTIQSFYENLLAEHDLAPDFMSTCDLAWDEMPKGFYRHIVAKPWDVDHKIISYEDEDSLTKHMPSDLDLLLRAAGSQNSTVSTTRQQQQQRNKTSLILEFSLAPSTYATMALREIIQPELIVSTNKSN